MFASRNFHNRGSKHDEEAKDCRKSIRKRQIRNAYLKRHSLLDAREVIRRCPGLASKDTFLLSIIVNNTELVTRLLKQGFNPNIRDSKGNTALSTAIKYGHTQMVKTLLFYGASTGYTPDKIIVNPVNSNWNKPITGHGQSQLKFEYSYEPKAHQPTNNIVAINNNQGVYASQEKEYSVLNSNMEKLSIDSTSKEVLLINTRITNCFINDQVQN